MSKSTSGWLETVAIVAVMLILVVILFKYVDMPQVYVTSEGECKAVFLTDGKQGSCSRIPGVYDVVTVSPDWSNKQSIQRVLTNEKIPTQATD